MQSPVVEPVDPFQGGELDVCERSPGAFAVDLLGLEQADRGLGQRVVVAVADRAHGGVGAGIDEPPRECEAGVLPGLNRSSQQFVSEVNLVRERDDRFCDRVADRFGSVTGERRSVLDPGPSRPSIGGR